MIPRDKVLLSMPSFDRRIDIGCMQGIAMCAQWFGPTLFQVGTSNISLARNEIAHVFVEKFPQCEWMMMVDSDIVFTRDDWQLLWEHTTDDDGRPHDVVMAQYAKKQIGEKPVNFGLGFTRVHRRVFEAIKELKTDDGKEYAQRFYHKGEILINYFPNGVMMNDRWVGEDHGFFLLASLTDIKPRIETRTRLRHVGFLEYGYPDQLPGWNFVPEEDGAN